MNYFHAHYPYGLYITTRIVALSVCCISNSLQFLRIHLLITISNHHANAQVWVSAAASCALALTTGCRLNLTHQHSTVRRSSVASRKRTCHFLCTDFTAPFVCAHRSCWHSHTLKATCLCVLLEFCVRLTLLLSTLTCSTFPHVLVVVRMRRAILYKRRASDRTQHHSSDSIRTVQSNSSK